MSKQLQLAADWNILYNARSLLKRFLLLIKCAIFVCVRLYVPMCDCFMLLDYVCIIYYYYLKFCYMSVISMNITIKVIAKYFK